MSYTPFDTTLVEARLKAQAPALREVAGAAEYAAVKELRGFTPPSAFVIFADEAPGDTPTGSSLALAVARIGVVIAARNYRAGAGGQLGQELLEVIAQVRAALIGWKPSSNCTTAITWAGGGLMDYDNSTALYVDTFSLTHILTPTKVRP